MSLDTLRMLGMPYVIEDAGCTSSTRTPDSRRTHESGRDVVICVAPGAANSEALVDRHNWYLLHGDTDV
jgi:hypothetical protein